MSSLDARVHGGENGAELAALGLRADEVLDFSVNTNVYGPCPAVVEAVRSAALHRYPDPASREARRRLSSALNVTPEQVLLGNGAAELLWTLARWYSRTASKVLVMEPTFCEFRAACAASGIRTTELRATEETHFAVDLGAVARAAREERANVVYLCSPNTPTGVSVPAAEIAAWAGAHPGLRVVLDQSFLSLSERAHEATVAMPDTVVRVRSLTKDHAIPGVRAGYALGPAESLRALEHQQPAWNVSALAQAAVIAACENEGFVEESRRRLLDDRTRLRSMLGTLLVTTFPTSTIYFLARVGSAARVRERLLSRHRILVRDCTSFGLPDLVRLAARPENDAATLVRALKEELPRCWRLP